MIFDDIIIMNISGLRPKSSTFGYVMLCVLPECGRNAELKLWRLVFRCFIPVLRGHDMYGFLFEC